MVRWNGDKALAKVNVLHPETVDSPEIGLLSESSFDDLALVRRVQLLENYQNIRIQ